MSTNDGVTYTLVDETLRHITVKELTIQHVLKVSKKCINQCIKSEQQCVIQAHQYNSLTLSQFYYDRVILIIWTLF